MLLQLLEKATRSFVSVERYRNDPRYIELWVAYADLLPEPGDVFKYLHANRIGEDCALFFMAWAWCAEHKGNVSFADKVYKRGIARKAAPIERLSARYRQFQRRMFRKWMEAQGVEGAAPGATAPMVDLDALTAAMREATAGPGGKVIIPDVKSAAIATRAEVATAQVDENARTRSTLGRITGHAAERSHRPTAYAEDGAYREDRDGFGQTLEDRGHPQLPSSGATRVGGGFGGGLKTVANPSQKVKQVAPPSIFEDEGLQNGRHDELGVQLPLPLAPLGDAGGERVPLQSHHYFELGTEAARKKENEEAPSKWTAPLPVRAGVLAPSQPIRGESRIPIYVDDDKKEAFAAAAAAPPLVNTTRKPAVSTSTTTLPKSTARSSAPSATTVPSGEVGSTDTGSTLCFEEVRAAAWLSSNASLAAELANFKDRLVKGCQTRGSIYDKSPPPKAPLPVATHNVSSLPPSPVYPTSFSPGARSGAAPGGGERTVRESMLNRLFEDVDEEAAESGLQKQQNWVGGVGGSAQAVVAPITAAVAAPVSPSIDHHQFQHLAGFGSGEDVSSIQGDGSTCGNIAVTVHTGDYRNMFGGSSRRTVSPVLAFPPARHQSPTSTLPLHQYRPAPPAHPNSIPIFSDFENDTFQPHHPQVSTTAASNRTSAATAPPPTKVSPPLPQQYTLQSFTNSSNFIAAAKESAGDITLHTRLAMDDLDGIFNSPSSKNSPQAVAQRKKPVAPNSFTAPPSSLAQPPLPPPALVQLPLKTVAAPPPLPQPEVVMEIPKKVRALPPDARRLSLGFSLNRRQSGIGLPHGRLSVSHATDKKSALPHSSNPFTILEDVAGIGGVEEVGGNGARGEATQIHHQQRPSLPSAQSFPAHSRYAAADEDESVDSRESLSSVDTEAEELKRGAGYSVSDENNGPRAQRSPPVEGRRVLAPAPGYAESGGGSLVFGVARGFGGARDMASIRHPLNPGNNFHVAVDPEFEGQGAHAFSGARFQ